MLEMCINLTLVFVANETPNQMATSGEKAVRDRDACFWQDLYVSLPIVFEIIKGLYPLSAGRLHSLE